MMRFCQPSDYRFKGRNVWFNPADVVSIKHGESYSECIIVLRNGDAFTVDMTQDEAGAKINEALKEEK